MVQIEELRSEFASRLREALDYKGIGSWGAGARLAKIAGVTPKASSKWLNGESMPGGANMLELANSLGVRVEWLEYGRGSMLPGDDGGIGRESNPADPDHSRGGHPDLRGGDPHQDYGLRRIKLGRPLHGPAGRRSGPALIEPIPFHLSPTSPDDQSVSVGNSKALSSASVLVIDFLRHLASNVPLTMHIRQVREALSQIDGDDAAELSRAIVGIHKNTSEVLLLVDSLLEAAAFEAIDLDEIRALTTLVQKRRNEKVHGKDDVPGRPSPRR